MSSKKIHIDENDDSVRIIMVIFMMIYAIIAVEYFAQLGQGCEGREEAGGPDGRCFGLAPYNTFITFNDDGTNQTLSAQTDRGFAFGWEYYGTFTRALFTLFQVMTGERLERDTHPSILTATLRGTALPR